MTEAPSAEVLPAGPGDLRPISDLCRQLGYEPSEADILKVIGGGNANHTVLVATLDGRVVGWIEVAVERHLTGGDEAMICGLVVDETVRSRKIGRQLVDAAENWARERGVSQIRVRSRVEREGAHRFYLRLGYGEVKRQAVFRKELS